MLHSVRECRLGYEDNIRYIDYFYNVTYYITNYYNYYNDDNFLFY
jgi:hypothetical protein